MDKITHKVRCEQWANIIKECLASGTNKTVWCREHGISDAMAEELNRQLKDPKTYASLSFEERFVLIIDAECADCQPKRSPVPY